MAAKSPAAKERQRESHRKWQEKNLEKENERKRKWRTDNPERAREIDRKARRKWRAKNPEKMRELAHKWRAKNLERARELDRNLQHKWSAELSDSYVSNRLTERTTLRASDIPAELIEAKRVHIKTLRLLKEQK